ncbi:MAG: ATP-binding protein [Deltaproteobacteria bacterium]|nr:MAG: ATP-binding protein [Deltaproteobacteria bacterium]
MAENSTRYSQTKKGNEKDSPRNSSKYFHLRFIVPGDVQELAAIRDRVEKQSASMNLSDEEAYQIVSAVDETCTNIIKHAYQGKEGNIEISLKVDSERFEIEVADKGIYFDPTLNIPQEIDQEKIGRQKGGLGLFIIKKTMDDLNYRFTMSGENKLHLVKYFRSE